MKNTIFLLFSLLLIVTGIKGQPPAARVTFTNVTQMFSYAGSYTECFLDDIDRGGYFVLKAAPSIMDSGVNFPSGKAGKAWVRDLGQSKSLYLSWFGVKGDGASNDFYRMKAFADYMTRDSATRKIINVYFGKDKTYYLDYRNTTANTAFDINFVRLKGVNIYGGDCKILINGNFTRLNNNDRNTRLRFDSCRNITVNNLTIDMQSNLTIRGAFNEPAAYCFHFSASDGVVLTNCVALNAACDGFNFNEGSNSVSVNGNSKRLECRNITMINCRSLFSARQAISLIQVYGFTAINCQFKYTGQNALVGGAFYAPQSGCDIEPNRNANSAGTQSYQTTGNITFIGCEFAANRGSQFTFGGAAYNYHDITVQNCIFNDVDSTNGIVYGGVAGGGYSLNIQGTAVRFINNTFTFKYGFLGLGYGVTSYLDKSDLLFEGNKFYYKDSALQWIRSSVNISTYREIKFINNSFIGDSTCVAVAAGSVTLMALATKKVYWDNNYVFVPKEKFRLGNPNDNLQFADMTNATVKNSTFATDLYLTYLGGAADHYNVNMANTKAQNVTFIGTNPGFLETIRPMEGTNNYGNVAFNSNLPLYSRNGFRNGFTFIYRCNQHKGKHDEIRNSNTNKRRLYKGRYYLEREM